MIAAGKSKMATSGEDAITLATPTIVIDDESDIEGVDSDDVTLKRVSHLAIKQKDSYR